MLVSKMTYFFDTYAIIELIEGSSSYKKFEEFRIVTSVLNIGEIYAIFLRNDGKERADKWFEGCSFDILEFSLDDIVKATYFRYINRQKNISITDSVGYILSLKHKLKFLTGDRQFQNMSNVEFIK